MRPLDGAVVDLLPCVCFCAGPDAQFIRLFGDLGSERVPERLAFCADWCCELVFLNAPQLDFNERTEFFVVFARIAPKS